MKNDYLAFDFKAKVVIVFFICSCYMFVPYYCTKIFNMKKFEQVWLGQIDVVIANNIANVDFRITDVAKELDVSRTKLYRDVLKLTG